MKYRLLLIVTLLLSLTGCHKTDSGEDEYMDEIYHADMQYMDFDKVDDLLAFFDSVATVHPLVKWLTEEEYAEEQARRCIVQIDLYRRGERQYFPDSLVSACMRSMGFNIAAVDNHGPEFTDRMDSCIA